MYCPECGMRLTGDEAFCTRCGHGVSSITGAGIGAGIGSGTDSDLGPLPGAEGPGYSRAVALHVPWKGGQVALGIALVGMAFVLISSLLVLMESTDWIKSSTAWAAWLGSHAIGVVILVAVWLLARSDGRVSLADLGLCQPRLPWPTSLMLAALALGASFGGTALYAWLMKPLGIDLLLPPDLPRELVFQGLAAFWTFEALSVFTPLTEEIFFRGFVMAGLVSRLGVVGAAVGSALIFSVFHLHPGVLLPIFFTGLLLAGLYYYTGSLWLPIIAHAVQNAIALTAILYGG